MQNQLGGQLSPKIDEVYTRITAAPSDWHKDIRSLYEGTATAISMHQQSRPGHPSRAAANLAAEVARSVMDKVEEELRAYKWNSNPLLQGMLRNRGNSTVSAPRPALEAQLFVCGLLDLLNQLIATFPKSEETVSRGKALALRLIRRSEERVFRYKAVSMPLYLSCLADGCSSRPSSAQQLAIAKSRITPPCGILRRRLRRRRGLAGISTRGRMSRKQRRRVA